MMAKSGEQNEMSVGERLRGIEIKVDLLRKDYMKMFYAMLGIIAATIGVKYIGTPFIVHVAAYFALLTGVFLALSTATLWNRLTWRRKLLRLSFCVLLLLSVGCRIWVYQVGAELPPPWLSPMIDGLYAFVALVLLLDTWTRWDGH